jgi:hypothetical protein
MAYKALLDEVNKRVSKELLMSAPVWYDDIITGADMKWIKEQAGDSKFDVGGLRSEMLGDLNKTSRIISKRCQYGRVIIIHYGSQEDAVWELWGRILRLFDLKGVRIVWFAHPKPRLFPSKKE